MMVYINLYCFLLLHIYAYVCIIPVFSKSSIYFLPHQALVLKTESQRRITQEMHEQEYQQALITVKDKIRETEGPDMKEMMMDQIRQWFIECR